MLPLDTVDDSHKHWRSRVGGGAETFPHSRTLSWCCPRSGGFTLSEVRSDGRWTGVRAGDGRDPPSLALARPPYYFIC